MARGDGIADGVKMKKERYIVLTDIACGVEIDDIQSMIRLLLYSDSIDIEGLIACTSCFNPIGVKKHEKIIHDLIDAYAKVRKNLLIHSKGWPEAEYLHSVTCSGINVLGICKGIGFAHKRYVENAGVRRIIEAVDKKDSRPINIGLWGGANTLAQAIWQVQNTRSAEEFDRFLSKMRIYGISDQDRASLWIRKNYGNRLFYIVSPSKGSVWGSKNYWRATWPGISSDDFKHGSEDGVGRTKGFTGADKECISTEWLKRNILSKGELGKLYPLPSFIMEGDTPAFLWLIPNGLNVPSRPDYGGWGGRYRLYVPDRKAFGVEEKYPIWTNSSDSVSGTDGIVRTSPQATIWRWRTAFQNDFAARMVWTVTDDFRKADHPPVLGTKQTEISVRSGEKVSLDVVATDPDGGTLECRWLVYKEAGTCETVPEIHGSGMHAEFFAPCVGEKSCLHVIAEVSNKAMLPLTRYVRFVVTVLPC